MAINIEIKARLQNPAQAAEIAQDIAGAPPDVIEQDDVFYSAPRGRIKLRTLAPDRGELIYYDRPDTPGPSACEYTIAPTSDPAALDAILCQTLGARGRIRKTRKLFQVGRTRIHVDDVENLGQFLELEVALNENEAPEAGEEEARELMRRLGVEKKDLLEYAYIDLMEMGTAEE